MKKERIRFRISELIAKKHTSILSSDESRELDIWINESKSNSDEYYDICNKINDPQNNYFYNNIDISKEWRKFQKHKGKRVIDIRIALIKYAAIIIVPIMLAVLVYNNFDYEAKSKEIAQQFDFSPGESFGFLELSNGKILALSRESSDTVIRFNESNISNVKNTLICDSKEVSICKRTKLEYNTLKIPKRGEYSVLLSDGTTVQLNSESEFKFPNTFHGNTREVFLKGEAYFNVTKDHLKPFIVHINGVSVKVFGTSFNIENRGDDEDVKTTLVDGSVQMIAGNKSVLLKPNQQAVYSVKESEISVNNVDVRKYIAWKNGMFYFEKERLDVILENISRWYGTEVFYINPSLKEQIFSVEVKRYENMTRILGMLQKTGRIKFDNKNNTIIVYK